jgi:hypothetical protein
MKAFAHALLEALAQEGIIVECVEHGESAYHPSQEFRDVTPGLTDEERLLILMDQATEALFPEGNQTDLE